MAQFQYTNGRAVPSAISTVVGSTLPLKLIPGPGERVPIELQLSSRRIAEFTNVNVRTTANFTSFSVRAVSAGRVVLSANATTTPVTITVEERLELPAANTDAGLYARIFLAEVRSPGMAGYAEGDVEDAMIMMRSVIYNRYRNPSYLYASDGATSIADVVRRPGQFEGFGGYPTIAAGPLRTITDIMAIANNGADPRSPTYRRYVLKALDIARRAAVIDPSRTGLYFWRTAGSGAPSPRVELFRTVLGNSFYRLK
jgi:Cell Wall Hydrolase